ncbi:MAG: YciI family protein, partial [Methyloligellaceae bacterium]
HLEFVRGLGDKIKLAGPLMDDEGRYPNGTILVIEAENLDEAKSIAQNDPYAQANLFENVTVRAWNWTVGNPGN